jgi:glycosyltransferase involved in cell wall biosynthesis
VKASIVVTVRNEARHIEALLSSLKDQGAHEVILVDANSSDDTEAKARAAGQTIQGFQLIVQGCTRGEGRNVGVAAATGDVVAFIDGDCTAEPGWLAALTAGIGNREDRIAAGHTVLSGKPAFSRLHRVELAHRGQDTTWPSCNLAYPRSLFKRLGGFDAAFVTAEDIDLNFRAVSAGATIIHVPGAVVHARARSTFRAFLRQAYWNGYGRKQLTRKHGRLWKDYKFTQLLRLQAASFSGLARLGAGLVGYLVAKAKGEGPRGRKL